MEIHILGNCRARNYENFLNVHYGYLNIWMEVSGAHTLGLPSFRGQKRQEDVLYKHIFLV